MVAYRKIINSNLARVTKHVLCSRLQEHIESAIHICMLNKLNYWIILLPLWCLNTKNTFSIKCRFFVYTFYYKMFPIKISFITANVGSVFEKVF